MTIHVRRRTHPVAAHAYTMPIVREIPISASSAAVDGTPQQPAPALDAATTHAW